MMKKLKERWGITSNFQILIIFIVFAITGSTSALISGPLTEYLIGDINMNSLIKFIIRIIVLTPIYQVLLLFFGFIFFQFNFFFQFVKKFLTLIGLLFTHDSRASVI